MSAENDDRAAHRVSRRGFMLLATGSLGGLVLSSTGVAGAFAAQAAPSPSPKLPGEYYRKGNQVTAAGTLFDNICVRINGDVARLHVPQTVKPDSGVAVPVVWFYHGAGSDHNALDGGFKKDAGSAVDSGAIAICQTDGGTLYSHPTAQALQVAGYSWISGIYTVANNTLRATSGGGALACETYAGRLVPNIVGMYNVNAVYDIGALYSSGGEFSASVVAAFGNDPAAIAAANPARYPSSAWSRSTVRVIVSQPNSSDRTVPPEQHGLKLLSVAAPTATEASMRVHANGHSTPLLVTTDFPSTRARWLAPSADVTAPTVRVTSPASGAALTGVVSISAAAGDDVSVATVEFTAGNVRIPARMNLDSITVPGQASAMTWVADLDSKVLANGTVAVAATAKDSAGNTSTSAAVTVTVFNSDTTPPTVSVVSPAAGSSVQGTVQVSVAASDNVAVTGVTVAVGGTALGAATQQADGRWTVPWDTTTAARGQVSLTATATDGAGNSAVSAPVAVTVSNPDRTAPTCAIVSPTDRATVSGTVTARVTASDDIGVASVGLYAGTRLVGWATAQGGDIWTLTFNTKTKTTPNGAYVLTAQATDAAGNVGVSPAVNITIKN